MTTPTDEEQQAFIAFILDFTPKMERFLDAIGKRHDPRVLNYIPASEILADMRTIQAILDKYKATIYVPPAPPPKRGPSADEFWDAMARREQEERANGKRDKAIRDKTLAEYRKRPEAQHESPEEQRTHAATMIHAARKRLKMPTKQYKKL